MPWLGYGECSRSGQTLNQTNIEVLTLLTQLGFPTQTWGNRTIVHYGIWYSPPHCMQSCVLSTFCLFVLMQAPTSKIFKIQVKCEKLRCKVAGVFAEICRFYQKMSLKWPHFACKVAPFFSYKNDFFPHKNVILEFL